MVSLKTDATSSLSISSANSVNRLFRHEHLSRLSISFDLLPVEVHCEDSAPVCVINRDAAFCNPKPRVDAHQIVERVHLACETRSFDLCVVLTVSIGTIHVEGIQWEVLVFVPFTTESKINKCPGSRNKN